MNERHHFVEITKEGNVVSPASAPMRKILFVYLKKNLFTIVVFILIVLLIYSATQEDDTAIIAEVLACPIIFIGFVLFGKKINRKEVG